MIQNRDTTPVKGFSLVEVVMALAIVSIAGLTLLASLAQTSQNAGINRSRDDSNQIEDLVRGYIQGRSFAGLYEELQKEDPVFYSYHYRADPIRRRNDESFFPEGGENGIVAGAVRNSEDPLLSEDLTTREGEAFRIRFTPVNRDFASVAYLPSDLADFDSPSLALFVEVYQDPLPGTNEGEWIESRKRLSFPLLISR